MLANPLTSTPYTLRDSLNCGTQFNIDQSRLRGGVTSLDIQIYIIMSLSQKRSWDSLVILCSRPVYTSLVVWVSCSLTHALLILDSNYIIITSFTSLSTYTYTHIHIYLRYVCTYGTYVAHKSDRELRLGLGYSFSWLLCSYIKIDVPAMT